jgi:hypothetical protein
MPIISISVKSGSKAALLFSCNLRNTRNYLLLYSDFVLQDCQSFCKEKASDQLTRFVNPYPEETSNTVEEVSTFLKCFILKLV